MKMKNIGRRGGRASPAPLPNAPMIRDFHINKPARIIKKSLTFFCDEFRYRLLNTIIIYYPLEHS